MSFYTLKIQFDIFVSNINMCYWSRNTPLSGFHQNKMLLFFENWWAGRKEKRQRLQKTNRPHNLSNNIDQAIIFPSLFEEQESENWSELFSEPTLCVWL